MSAFLIGIIAGCIAATVLYALWRVKHTKDPAEYANDWEVVNEQ